MNTSTTAKDLKLINRAINIFKYYGYEVEIEDYFIVKYIGLYSTARDLFTAASAFDKAFMIGYHQGIKDINECDSS